MLPLLNHLWNLGVEQAAVMPWDNAVRDFTRHQVDLAAALGLIMVDRPRHRSHSVALAGCGRIVVESAMREAGQEPYLDSEEKRMTYFHDESIRIHDSPGAAVVRGDGTATGGNVSGLDAEIVDMLRQLVAAVDQASSGLKPDDRDVVEASAESINGMLSSDRPDLSKLRRATRTILSRLETITLGAAGSGAWTGLAGWAGM